MYNCSYCDKNFRTIDDEFNSEKHYQNASEYHNQITLRSKNNICNAIKKWGYSLDFGSHYI